jgi:hypothetical protein
VTLVVTLVETAATLLAVMIDAHSRLAAAITRLVRMIDVSENMTDVTATAIVLEAQMVTVRRRTCVTVMRRRKTATTTVNVRTVQTETTAKVGSG